MNKLPPGRGQVLQNPASLPPAGPTRTPPTGRGPRGPPGRAINLSNTTAVEKQQKSPATTMFKALGPFKILCVGNTGAGKSTFMECQSESVPLISTNITKSFTTESCIYKLNDYWLIDTPGVFDSEGRTQEMMDDLFSNCYEFGSLHCVILFHKWNGRFDDTWKTILNDFLKFMGPTTSVKRNLVVCITGDVADRALVRKDAKEGFGLEIFFLDINDKAFEAQYKRLIDKCKELVITVPPINTKTMQRIITFKKQIEDLNKQLQEATKDQQKSAKLKAELEKLYKEKKKAKLVQNISVLV